MRRRPGLAFAGSVLAVALVAGGCSRGSELGPREAVEILVIDGVDRAQAACMIADLAGRISLEKVTGVDTDLTPEEIDILATSSAACKVPLTSGGGVDGAAKPAGELEGVGPLPNRRALVTDLVRGGMDPVVAGCLADATLGAPDPVAALADDQYRANALLECEASPPG